MERGCIYQMADGTCMRAEGYYTLNIRLKNEGPVGFSYRACIHPTDGHGVTIYVVD
jgi:hypothetical protein